MAYKQNCSAFTRHIIHFAKALFLKFRIADRQDFIHDQYLGIQMGRNRKGQVLRPRQVDDCGTG